MKLMDIKEPTIIQALQLQMTLFEIENMPEREQIKYKKIYNHIKSLLRRDENEDDVNKAVDQVQGNL